MNKLLITAIFTITTVICFAQAQAADHLIFKGVPIDGTLSEYVTKMKQQGFTPIGAENGVSILKGDFASYKDCIVGVVTLEQKDLVSRITVIFPERGAWSSLVGNYFDLKEMLTQKYGEPTEYVEEFDSYSEPKDDGSRMNQVMFDNCKYYTTYETDKGTIQLSIEHDGVLSCYVMLAYFDKINSDIVRAKAIDDL